MGSKKAVLAVHAGRQAQFGHAPQDERLVGGLLSVFAEQNDPSRVERAVDIVVAAVHVKRVLGQRPSDDLQHRRRALARGVIILLDAVQDSLAGGEIHDPFATHGVRDGAALRRVLPLGFHRQGAAAENIQAAFGIGLLIEFT
jgi:hypothetical protein